MFLGVELLQPNRVGAEFFDLGFEVFGGAVEVCGVDGCCKKTGRGGGGWVDCQRGDVVV